MSTKPIFWFLTLFAIVFAGDRLGGWLLQKQADTSQFRYSRLYSGDAAADILLVGNSRGLTFYQPYIEEKTGLATFNLSYNGLPMDLAKVLVQDYFDRYPAPRVMIVDITTCDRLNKQLIAGFLPYATHSPRLDTLIHRSDTTAWYGSRVSALFRFNNEVFQRALYYRDRSDEDWLLDRVIADKLVADAANNSYDLKIKDDKARNYLLRQLAEMTRAARAKGVAVRLVVSPYFPDFQVKNLEEFKTEVEQATGLPVHDYRAALADPTAFGDFMHPNKKGAMAYIDLMRQDAVLP